MAVMPMPQLSYRLVRAAPSPARPVALDADQQAVVEHRGGPLLVLAGPGTGKTTTLVEAVAHRVAAGLRPENILVLTFSRKAAGELRDRIATRLSSSCVPPLASTFHAFCYALGRAYQPAELFQYPLRLLSGPEQDVAVRELLRGDLAGGLDRIAWPQELHSCLTTRGFAEEIRAVIARTRGLGVEPRQLTSVARQVGRADWAAVAEFLAEYLDVLDAQGVVDYAELVHRAALLVARDEIRAELRERYRAVFVDEYQDTDPSQVRLLTALAGDGRHLTVFGDPDQSIYAFRGADVQGILDFPDVFRQRNGAPAPVRVLRVSRRAGSRLLAASRSLTRRMPLVRLPVKAVQAHRNLIPASEKSSQAEQTLRSDAIEVLIFPTPGAELDGVADLLRRAHLEHGLPWREMAVLVRSGIRSIPSLRRVLGAAGIPLEVAGDELPLSSEPAVAPLLLALHCAADMAALTSDAARRLLLSPLGNADVAGLRQLGRALRAQERQAGSDGRLPRPSAELIREAVAEPANLTVIPERIAAPAHRLGRLLRQTRQVLRDGGTPEQSLWELWSGTSWPARLERTAARGGSAGRSAHRDLDAVCALFDAAARTETRLCHRGVRNFLAEIEAQQIPGDPLAERPVRAAGVRLLTAHRAKGLQWQLVVVAGVQEGAWPDIRRRGSVLEPDRIGPDGLAEPLSASAILAEERRLFYVAVTRAAARLVVTAVRSTADDGEVPSRFVDELGVAPIEVTDRPRRSLSLAGLTAELRSVAADPTASEPLRRSAAARLAVLAAGVDAEGFPLASSAHPDRWWGLADLTDPGVPIRNSGQPVALSGSSVQVWQACPLRWLLSREVHAASARTSALGFGSLLHVLADDVARDRIPAQLPALLQRLDQVWDQLAFDAPWRSVQEKQEARAALERFLRWHTADRGRVLVATEQEFAAPLRVKRPDHSGDVEVVMRGRMDRVEQSRDGRVHVVDFKTGKRPELPKNLPHHPQLGVYQLATRAGALEEAPALTGARPSCGGAELVQLRHDHAGMPLTQRQPSAEPDEDGRMWADRLLGEVASGILAEEFPARRNESCASCEFRRCCPSWPEGRQLIP